VGDLIPEIPEVPEVPKLSDLAPEVPELEVPAIEVPEIEINFSSLALTQANTVETYSSLDSAFDKLIELMISNKEAISTQGTPVVNIFETAEYKFLSEQGINVFTQEETV